ncbi:MAG: hypothetical protein ACRDUY_10515 [Nitriliruptorales bacterium]
MGVQKLRRELSEKAYLFDDPRTYVAGVEDAMRAVEAWLREQSSGEGRLIDVSDPALEAAEERRRTA